MKRLWFRLTMKLRLCFLNSTDRIMFFMVKFLLFISIFGSFVVICGILFSVVKYLLN